MTVYTDPSDFHAAQEALEEAYPGVEFETLGLKMIPQEYVTIDNPEDQELWNRLLTLLNDVEDVQEIFHNVKEND